jgi:hypothetical protein
MASVRLHLWDGLMAGWHEIPPIMVLTESSSECMIFRFRGTRWGSLTLISGAGLLCICAGSLHSASLPLGALAALGLFGFLLLFSSVYSFTADQYLVVDGTKHSVHFHKKNLYGKAEWERGGDWFKRISVSRPRSSQGGRNVNYAITLVCADDYELYIGENQFGSFSHERALDLANRVGHLAGIDVVDWSL